MGDVPGSSSPATQGRVDGTLLGKGAKMLRADTDYWELCCPKAGCDMPPHLIATLVDEHPPKMSGPGVILEYRCEAGHRFQMITEDHSGSTYIRFAEMI